LGQDGCVTLNATINTMRSTRCGNVPREPSHVAQNMVKCDTLPVWDQLKTLKTDLRRGSRGTIDNEETMSNGSSETASEMDGRTLALNRRRFVAAVGGAVRLSETSREKFVLACAERQVLQVEDRWATMTPSRCPSVCSARTDHYSSASRVHRGPSGASRKSPGSQRPSLHASSSEPALTSSSRTREQLPPVTPPSRISPQGSKAVDGKTVFHTKTKGKLLIPRVH